VKVEKKSSVEENKRDSSHEKKKNPVPNKSIIDLIPKIVLMINIKIVIRRIQGKTQLRMNTQSYTLIQI
jgi:hypothetical protein